MDPLLEPLTLGHLTLRNRIVSTAHAPWYQEGGHPRERYRLYQEEKVRGGVGLTIIGGSTNVAPDSPSGSCRQIGGVTDWLVHEIELLGVEVWLNRYAEAKEVIAEAPG